MCCNWSYQLTSPTSCKQRSFSSKNCFLTVLRSVLRWSLLQNTKCKPISETVPILKSKIWVYYQDGANVRTMLLNKKNNRWDYFWGLFTNYMYCPKNCVSRGKQGKKKYRSKNNCNSKHCSWPSITPWKNATAMETANLQNWSQMTCQRSGRETTLIQLKLQEEQLEFLEVILQITHLLFLKGTEVLQ